MEARLAVLGVDGVRNKAGKSFLAKGVAFALDARGEVPVWLEARELHERDFAHLVGRAKLSVHENVLWADCSMLDDRLPGSLMKILYPHPCGKIIRAAGDIIHEMLVDGVNLSAETPLDPRIATLNAQGVRARKKG